MERPPIAGDDALFAIHNREHASLFMILFQPANKIAILTLLARPLMIYLQCMGPDVLATTWKVCIAGPECCDSVHCGGMAEALRHDPLPG